MITWSNIKKYWKLFLKHWSIETFGDGCKIIYKSHKVNENILGIIFNPYSVIKNNY